MTGYQKHLAEFIPKLSPPNVLSWFDCAAHHDPEPCRMGRGSSSDPPGFPTVREPHRPEGNRGIEAFGNDKLLEVSDLWPDFPITSASPLACSMIPIVARLKTSSRFIDCCPN